MNVSIRWLSDMLGREIDPKDAAERLALLGAPVEGVESVGEGLGDVVVGVVREVSQHPNADRLTLCQVDAGGEIMEVVCGAPNVKAGAKYPFAPDGSTLPGGFKLKARKIRGVKSNGMLCSARELELGTDHEGILELATDAEPGTALVEALDLSDTRLTLEVTPNRPDLLCHRGVARELGSSFGAPVKLPVLPGVPEVPAARRSKEPGSVDGVEVSIEDPEGCPRYMAAVIRGVRVGASPEWLQTRLRSIGARPINNVVDATNYILYEMNQPMHAFDIERLRGDRIVVREARAGEKHETLDGVVRDLQPGMTMICDDEGPVGVGGVMGGANSEVSQDTTDILLECAYFDPKRIRATRTALKMSTDASYRFERGTDIEAMESALRRAVGLIIGIAGGSEPEPALDVYPKPRHSPTVFLRPSRVEHLLGVAVPRDEIERYLSSIGFTVAPKDDRLAVQVPGWRPDVLREVDLIEEVARLRGYDSFPVELRPFRPSNVPHDAVEVRKDKLRSVLTASGLHEARTLSLVSEGSSDGPPVLNPLSQDETHLRSALMPGLIRSVERNWSVRVRDVRLFEIGVVFGAPLEDNRPEETLRVAAVVTGARRPPHWSTGGKSPDYDLWDLKELVREVAVWSGKEVSTETDGERWKLLTDGGDEVGWAGPVEADSPPWAAPVWGFEIDLDSERAVKPADRYREIPSTPELERDLALVVPEDVTAEQVVSAMREIGGALLEEVRIFDEYRSDELSGRSLAWRLTLRAPNRTLRDKDADRMVDRMLEALKEKLGVSLRQA